METLGIIELKRTEPLQTQIEGLEKQMGITGGMERCVEAANLIDRKYLETALVTGQDRPERLFGDWAWRDWLEARVWTRKYGDQPLSLDFIKGIHERLVVQEKENDGGKWRDVAIVGTDPSHPGQDDRYKPEQIEALKANGLLVFESGNGKCSGRIRYPEVAAGASSVYLGRLSTESQELFNKSDKTTNDLMEALLTEVVGWYNQEKEKGELDPVILAAELERRIVSIHPMTEYNGRLARALMFWSLESRGLEVSFLDNPHDDILVGSEEWVGMVFRGIEETKNIKKRMKKAEAVGIEDPVWVFDLDKERTFYQYVWGKNVNFCDRNGLLDYDRTKFFLREIREGVKKLDELYRVNGGNSVFGGLIPESYIDNVGRPMTEELRRWILSNYFRSEASLYRGAVVNKRLKAEDMIRFFSTYVGSGSGYQVLEEGETSPFSSGTVAPELIEKSLRDYNLLVGDIYRRWSKKLPWKWLKPRGLEGMVEGHHNAGKAESVFVSTTKRVEVARGFAVPQGGDDGLGLKSENGIVIVMREPLFGGISTSNRDKFTYSWESEVLLPGGIDPESVVMVKFYDRLNYSTSKGITSFSSGNLAMMAERFENGGMELLKITDLLQKTEKIYKWNSTAGKFEMIEETGEEMKVAA